MSDKIRAAEELKRFGRAFKNMLDVIDDLERVGSIENAANEAEVNFQRAKASLESIEQQIKDADIRRKAADEVERIQSERISATRLESERQANDILDRANIEAQNIQNSTKSVVSGLKQELEVIKKDIQSHNELRMSIIKEIESLNLRKESAMAEARKIFGGE